MAVIFYGGKLAITDLDVLLALHPVEWRTGRQIRDLINQTQQVREGVFSGRLATVHVILSRLVDTCLAETKFGDDSEIRYGCRRYYYRLTSDGYRRRVELEASKESGPSGAPIPA